MSNLKIDNEYHDAVYQLHVFKLALWQACSD